MPRVRIHPAPRRCQGREEHGRVGSPLTAVHRALGLARSCAAGARLAVVGLARQ